MLKPIKQFPAVQVDIHYFHHYTTHSENGKVPKSVTLSGFDMATLMFLRDYFQNPIGHLDNEDEEIRMYREGLFTIFNEALQGA